MSAGIAVSFSGRIASGKTSVTKIIADVLGWPRAGFSDHLRAVLASKGISDPDREVLQNLGQSLVSSDPDKFCRDVIAQTDFRPGGNLVLDGIRHVDIQRRVARIVQPSLARLIHFAADDGIAAARERQRGTPETEVQRASQHSVEQELQNSLPQFADRTIDASQPLAVVVSECLASLEGWGVQTSTVAWARDRVTTLLKHT